MGCSLVRRSKLIRVSPAALSAPLAQQMLLQLAPTNIGQLTDLRALPMSPRSPAVTFRSAWLFLGLGARLSRRTPESSPRAGEGRGYQRDQSPAAPRPRRLGHRVTSRVGRYV